MAISTQHDVRHGHTTCSGLGVDVDVLHEGASEGSHLVIVIQAEEPGGPPQTVEYVTDCADFDQAMAAGFEIAREIIEENHRSSCHGRAPGGRSQTH